jgi:hypothetical protein
MYVLRVLLKSEKTGRRCIGSCAKERGECLDCHDTSVSKAMKDGMPVAIEKSAQDFRTMRTLFFLIIFEILITSGVFAQNPGSPSGHGDFDGILIAQAAVSNTTTSREQVAPQILPPLPQSEPSVASPASPAPKIPSLEELDQMFKQTSLGKEADEARLRQQLREILNNTINDSDLVATRAHAEAAPTDLLKRQRLRA